MSMFVELTCLIGPICVHRFLISYKLTLYYKLLIFS